MSKHDGKKVVYAALHMPIFVPDIGQMGPTLSSKASSINKSFKMTLEEPLLSVETKDKTNKDVTIVLPVSSLSHFVVEADESNS